MNNEEIKKQKARERAKKYYQENKEKVLARQKAYVKRKYEEDENYREKCKERRKRYEENNKERVKILKREAQKRHYHKHREYYRNYRKEYYRTYINKDKRKIEEALNKLQYIIDYGFDYDVFNTVESLKGLIDMLVDYAVQTKHILKGEDKEWIMK